MEYVEYFIKILNINPAQTKIKSGNTGMMRLLWARTGRRVEEVKDGVGWV